MSLKYRKISSSSFGQDADDESSFGEEDIFRPNDRVIVRKSRVNKEAFINNIYMFYGKVVGKQRCKPEKDKTYDDYKNSYCVEIIKYRTNKDNFKEETEIPGGKSKLIWAHPNEIFEYYGEYPSFQSLGDASMRKKDWYTDKELESMRRASELRKKFERDKEKKDLFGQQIQEINQEQFKMDAGGRKRKRRRKRTKKRGRKTRKKKREMRKTKKLPNGKDDRCAPKKKGDRLPYTCYTKSSLHKLKTIWNLRHPDAKILSNDPKEIWKSLKINFGDTCKRESCWLNQQFVKNKIDKSILKNTFRPSRPKQWKKNPDEWLNSVDIMKFMKQYEHLHKDFDFMGPSPIDYDTHLVSDECVWEELCKFNLKNTINNGKRKIGIIFNLDPHFKGGSHWVAMFINTNDKCIYYFDSYGEEIPDELYKFVKTIQNQSSNIGKQYNFKENRKRHQYSNTECGMFCLHFIRSMILHNNWKELTTKKLTDREMLRLRKVYYNP